MSRQRVISQAKRDRIRHKQQTRSIQAQHREYRNMRRGKKQSKLGLLLVIAALLVVTTVTTIRAYDLHVKSQELTITEKQLETELTNVKQKKTDLDTVIKTMQDEEAALDELIVEQTKGKQG